MSLSHKGAQDLTSYADQYRGEWDIAGWLICIMSCAFNILQLPLFKIKKIISEFKLETELALCVLDFLMGQPQHVQVNIIPFLV